MSDNDLIRRGNVREEIKKLTFNPLVNELLYRVLDSIPTLDVAKPASHEMSAREYEKAFQRITYEDVETYRVWWEAIHDEDWGRAVAIVEKWAREHPEERSEE